MVEWLQTRTGLFRSFRSKNAGCDGTGMYRLHGRAVKGVGHLGHDEAMEAGGRVFDPRPGHYSRMSF